MRIRLACAAALLLAACVKRVAPSAVEDRTVVSGVPTEFGSPADLPEGARIEWDFGDGTPPAAGPAGEDPFPPPRPFSLAPAGGHPRRPERQTPPQGPPLRRPGAPPRPH